MAWQPKQTALMTDWAQQVSTNSPWPEYPRPQMVRTNWLSLNGIWQWQSGATNEPLPGTLSGEILVPFPMESALSGVKQHYDWAWYRRTFTVPSEWTGQHVLLNFGAVNWRAEVFVNSVSVGVHEGGYDAFSFDISSYLANTGPQTLTIRVWSPVDNTGGYTFEPIGKQRIKPGGMCYTSSSGIWQSVWLEPVPATRVADMHLVPDIDNNRLRVNVTVSGPTNGIGVNAIALDGSTQAGSASGAPGADFYVFIPSAKLWWPTNPFLYDLQLTLTNSSGTVDSVASYVGMRKTSLTNSGGFVKVALNNSALFCSSPLDQGYWPDGIYTPPSDLAMRADLELIRAFGWNAVRKHLKVEPDRWYYWCDKMGLPVWQDMPSLHFDNWTNTPQSLTTFSNELTRMIVTHWNHPSIIVWTPYNEGGALPDNATANAVVQNVGNLDPSRLVDGNSGGGVLSPSQINDTHNYPDPACTTDASRAVVCGEHGGLGYYIVGHEWTGSGFSYMVEPDSDSLVFDFERFCYVLSDLVSTKGLCAAVYTENCDVENEENGLYTFDRKVMKADPRRIAAAMQVIKGQYSYSNVVPSSKLTAQTWSYTTNTPPANWYAPDFDSSSWRPGQGAFGNNVSGITLRTPWTTSDIWLRRTFNPGNLTAQQISNLVFSVFHDEDFEIYVDGVLACRSTDAVKEYLYLSMLPQARAAILPNATNCLAVHCNQTWGGQGIDVGIDLRTTVVAPPVLAPLPSWTENGSGLRGEYFADAILSSRVLLRSDPNIAFVWSGSSPGTGVPTNRFSVRWTGQIQPRYSEVYTFHLTASDGCRLWVDGQEVIDNWRDSLTNELTGSIALVGGQKYDLRLEYYDNTNSASVKLEWNSANQLRELVPQGVLFPNGGTGSRAWYSFEGDVRDGSGHGNDGAVNGNVTFVSGKIGAQAAQFDGTNACVLIPRCVSNDFSVAFWIKTTTTGPVGAQWYDGLGLVDGEVTGGQNDFGVSLLSNKVAVGVGDPDTTIVSSNAVNDGQWHYVVATRAASSGRMQIFVDGTLSASAASGPTGTKAAPPYLRIGSLQTGVSGKFFAGVLDDVKIYDRELSSCETSAATSPAAPSGVTATPISYNQINLSWTDNANDETLYQVERSLTSGSGYTPIATLGANATSYSDGGLVHGTSYYYRIRVYNACGEGVSMAVSTATPLNPDIPQAPSSLAATVVSSNQIALSWFDNSSNETGFKIERKTGAGGTYSPIALVSGDTTSYTDSSSLVAATLYYYRMRATSSAGDSAYSSEASATTCPANSVFWTGAADSSWTTSGNWVNAPVATRTVVYNNASINNLNQSLGQNWPIAGIVIGDPAGNITINAGYTLTNSGGIDMSSAARNLTNNAPEVLMANQTWAVAGNVVLTNSGAIANNGYTLTIDCATNATPTTNVYQYGSISGSGKVVKLGNGTVLWGTQGSYTNATVIGGGVIMSRGGGMNGLGASWSPIAITNYALYSLNGSSLSVGTLTLSDGNCGISKNGNLNFSNVVSLGDSTIGVSELRTGAGSSGMNYTSVFNVVDGKLTLAINRLYGQNNSTGTVVKSGNGTMAFASNFGSGTPVNSYAWNGATILNGGTLQVMQMANGGLISQSGCSSSDAANLVLNGGTLKYAGGAVSIDRLFSLGVNGGTLDASGSGALGLTNSGTVGFVDSGSHMLTLTGTSTGANTLAASLGDNGGPTALMKSGAGAWTLTGAHSFSGGTIVSGGTLTASSTTTLGTDNLSVSNGATCVIQNAGALASAAYVYLDGTGMLNLAYSGTNTVERLYLEGVLQPAGVWNAARDGAHFAGAGSLNVSTGRASGPMVLNAAPVGGGGLKLMWTNSAADLYYTPGLTVPVAWSLVLNQAGFSNGQWILTLPAGTNFQGFYRLQQ